MAQSDTQNAETAGFLKGLSRKCKQSNLRKEDLRHLHVLEHHLKRFIPAAGKEGFAKSSGTQQRERNTYFR